MIKNIKWLLLASISIVACSKEVEEEEVAVAPEVPVVAGSADFSRYVALGNSLTAGFSDNALFKAGQENSYPNLLAQQFKLAGGGEFKIPFMNDNIGGFLLNGAPTGFGPRLTIDGVSNNLPNVTSLALLGKKPTTDIINNIFSKGPYNNMGVPGAKSYHLSFAGYGQANPYFGRFASAATASVIDDALLIKPTFFSLWIGNNDVLGYASTGGSGVNQTGNLNPATYAANDITDPNVFASVYKGLVDKLVGANKIKGVVANIPYVSTIPQFTTVPTNPVPALPAANATQLNQLFGAINQITKAIGAADRFVVLSADDNNPATIDKTNPLLIIDETLPNLSVQITGALNSTLGPQTAAFVGNLYGQARHARNDPNAPEKRDFVPLTTRGLISPPNNTEANIPSPFNIRGVSYPLQDALVLTSDENSQIKTATDAYNATIKSLANANGLAFVDANALLAKVATTTGVSFGKYQLSASYVVGGAFSLDGVHPAPLGYALIANEFIKAINEKYGSTLRMVDITNFPIQYPKDLPN
jgi:hypothetical protein